MLWFYPCLLLVVQRPCTAEMVYLGFYCVVSGEGSCLVRVHMDDTARLSQRANGTISVVSIQQYTCGCVSGVYAGRLLWAFHAGAVARSTSQNAFKISSQQTAVKTPGRSRSACA
jgi:hypothetical protein